MLQTTAMRFVHTLLIMTLAFTAMTACKKSNTTNDDSNCSSFMSQETIRAISLQPAIIQQEGDLFFVVEEGAIDKKLRPCYLTQDLRVHNLKVVVTGEVKKSSFLSSYCCADALLILKIARR